MLDIMRKHTRSWLIKVVFAVIILVFIFFFGYSRMRGGGQGGGNDGIAARVNGEAISYSRYKLALDESREFYKKMFGGEIPEQFWPQISSSALYTIINQALLAQFAKKLGIAVTTAELFDTISKNPNFQKDGYFDPITYKKVFLPYFERRFGMNYEEMLAKELLAQKTAAFITEHVVVPSQEAKEEYIKENTTWTFDRIKVANITKGSITSGMKANLTDEEIANEVLEAARSGSKARLNKTLKKHSLESERLEEIDIASRHRLLSGELEDDVLFNLFSLNKKNSTVSAPLKAGSNYYIFKLVDLKEPSEKEWEESKSEFITNLTTKRKQDYLLEWQDNLKKGAKIEEYVLTTRK